MLLFVAPAAQCQQCPEHNCCTIQMSYPDALDENINGKGVKRCEKKSFKFSLLRFLLLRIITNEI